MSRTLLVESTLGRTGEPMDTTRRRIILDFSNAPVMAVKGKRVSQGIVFRTSAEMGGRQWVLERVGPIQKVAADGVCAGQTVGRKRAGRG